MQGKTALHFIMYFGGIMVRFYSLTSGSSGNSAFVSDGKANILIDCGLNGKSVAERLNSIDVSPESIDAILITHEHTDHISGAGIFSRRYDVPIYTTKKTWDAIFNSKFNIGKLSDKNICFIEKEKDFEIGKLGIKAFSTPHDSADSVGFNIYADNKKLSVATDMGKVDKNVVSHLLGSESILLESNHDTDMLINGAYPYWLKQRILGSKGHLSNESCAKIAVCLANNGTKKIVLGHLSDENNSPNKAYNTTKSALEQADIKIGSDIEIAVAERYDVTNIF